MDYCEHCEGQRFDRARVLRALRQIRRDLRAGGHREGRDAIERALRAVSELDIPHLDFLEPDDEIIH
jgi:undecaprenyl pyrophosphate synthase